MKSEIEAYHSNFVFQLIQGVVKSLTKLDRKFEYQTKDMDDVLDAVSKLNRESKIHLEECLGIESSNEDIIIEAEQKLHLIQEEEKQLGMKKEEIAKVPVRRIEYNNLQN